MALADPRVWEILQSNESGEVMNTMIPDDPIRTMHHLQDIEVPVQTSDLHMLLKNSHHRILILAVPRNRIIPLPDRKPNLALDGKRQVLAVLLSVMSQLMIQQWTVSFLYLITSIHIVRRTIILRDTNTPHPSLALNPEYLQNRNLFGVTATQKQTTSESI
jgi:hypothetical protein